MDILTHIVAGAALASTIRPKPHAVHAYITLTVSVLGSVAPDIDVVYLRLRKPFGDGGEGLAYALYHRGHTHTLLGCVVLATAIAGLVRFGPRLVSRTWSLPSFRHLLWIAFAGALLHLCLDATNDYGVHPFYPFWNAWIYGDFIVLKEPLIGLALLLLALRPVILYCERRPMARHRLLAWAAAMIPGLAYVWVNAALSDWVIPLAAWLATAWAAIQVCLQYRWRSPWVAWGSVAFACCVFFACSRWVKVEAATLLAARAPDEDVVQLVTTPAPANPFCWRVVVGSRRDSTGEVVARIGTRTFLPAWAPASSCYYANREDPPNAELDDSGLPSDDHWQWRGRFHALRSDFEALAKQSCRIDAMKHFLRVPFWTSVASDVVVGDLRMDYEQDLAHFAKYRYQRGEQEPCDFWLPPWTPPFFR